MRRMLHAKDLRNSLSSLISGAENLHKGPYILLPLDPVI